FEQELRRLKVPYLLVGGQSFFDRREIRDLMAYLKAIDNPRDEVSLLRIINTPARGIGESSTEKIIQTAVKTGTSFWDVSEQLAGTGTVAAKAGAALRDFRSLLTRYSAAMHERPAELATLARSLLQEINYESEIDKQYKEETQREVRRNILEEFVSSIGLYVEKNQQPTLSGFLESMALLDREEESDRGEEKQQDAVRLMTLHSAKGLEFPRVYLVGMEEGFLPHKRSIEEDTEKAIAEERRLAYVGITRAMDHLTLTRSKTRMKWGRRRDSMPSRFLFEMQEDPGQPLQEEHISKENADEHTTSTTAPFQAATPRQQQTIISQPP
ncbi:MAG: ATP-dependent helicase, partial [Planctomycetaceae bacterium]